MKPELSEEQELHFLHEEHPKTDMRMIFLNNGTLNLEVGVPSTSS